MDERDGVIDECIRAVLSLRRDGVDDERDSIETITGAACYRLMQLQSSFAARMQTAQRARDTAR